jgi:hypothetical protein
VPERERERGVWRVEGRGADRGWVGVARRGGRVEGRGGARGAARGERE